MDLLRAGSCDWFHASSHGRFSSGNPDQGSVLLLEGNHTLTPQHFVGAQIEDSLRKNRPAFVFNICHAAAPKLAAQKGGRIISIVGDSARVGQPRLGVSAGARGAVLSLTRTLAKELGRQNITVNSLALGWIETSHSDQEWIAKNRERILAFYPIRRLGKPEDVAPLVAFLASDLAGWVTGQTISVSGGYSTV